MEFGIMILNTSIPFNTGRRVLRACVLEYNLPRFVYLMSMYICMYLPGTLVCLCACKRFSSLSASIASTLRSTEVSICRGKSRSFTLCSCMRHTLFATFVYTYNCALYIDKVLCGCIQLVRWAVCMSQRFWNARCVYLISFYIYLYSMFVCSLEQKCLQLRRIL